MSFFRSWNDAKEATLGFRIWGVVSLASLRFWSESEKATTYIQTIFVIYSQTKKRRLKKEEMAKNSWKKGTKKTAGRSTGITMTQVWCYLCGVGVLRKLFVNRHWKRHCDNGDEYKGKPCSEYKFERVNNRLDLSEVCSSTPAAPPTRIHPKTSEVMAEFVIEEEKVSNLLWTLEAMLNMGRSCIGVHLYVSFISNPKKGTIILTLF